MKTFVRTVKLLKIQIYNYAEVADEMATFGQRIKKAWKNIIESEKEMEE